MTTNREHQTATLPEVARQIEHLTGRELYRALKNIFNTNYVTGLPCGELREFIHAASHEDPESIHLQASNERESVGIAAGAWLGGKKPILYMQNSGLFEASNDLGSLLIASEIPAVFVVSWRGSPGENATQHFATGAATKPLLDAFKVPYIDLPSRDKLTELQEWQSQNGLPVCILQIREHFNKLESAGKHERLPRKRANIVREYTGSLSNREEVLALIASMTPQSRALISSTGLISRSLFHHYDSPNQFYNAGAFGLTSSIGLGFASARPDVPVTIVEGDGSVLTNLGNLNLIGYNYPSNFLHIVLDNASYVSCSGEQTCGSELIPEFASISGYQKVFSITSPETLHAITNDVNSRKIKGPVLIHILINQEGERRFNRPLGMSKITRRFKSHFNPSR